MISFVQNKFWIESFLASTSQLEAGLEVAEVIDV